MSTLKKYKDGKWIPIATNQAVGIQTTIAKNDGTFKNVDEVLLDISKLKKNVTWLARHGGGGSGAGGTSTSSFKISIKNPVDLSQLSSGDIVYWNNTVNYIELQIISTDVGRTYSIYCSLATTSWKFQLSKLQRTTGLNTIKISTLGLIAYLGDRKAFNILVVNDLEEVENFSFYIINPSVKLSPQGVNTIYYNYDKNNLATSDNTRYINCTTSVPGTYRLYASFGTTMIVNGDGSVIGDNIYTAIDNLEINSTNNVLIPFNLLESFGPNINLDYFSNKNPGEYPVYFVLKNIEQPSIVSSPLKINLLIAPGEQLFIVNSVNEGTTFIKNINNTVSFTAYKGDSTLWFNYEISLVKGDFSTQLSSGTSVYGTLITKQFKFNIEGIEDNETYDLIISVNDEFYGYTETSIVSVNIAPPSTSLLHDITSNDLEDLIFDFTFENYSEDVGRASKKIEINHAGYHIKGTSNKGNVTTIMSLLNTGLSSGVVHRSYNFRHKACAKIDTIKYENNDISWFGDTGSSLFPPSSLSRSLTLHISYSVDLEENGIILFVGTKDNLLLSQSNIIIRPTSYEINTKSAHLNGSLTNEGFTQLDITIGLNGNDGLIVVYQNGKYLVANKIPSNDLLSLNFDVIYLGGIVENNLITESVNFDLLSLRFFSKELNIGQIVYSFINNYVRYTSRFLPNEDYDIQLLANLKANNGISDLKEGETLESCSVYSLADGRYTDWGINLDTQGNLTINSLSPLNKLPLPLVIIDISNEPMWTYNNFKDNSATSALLANENKYAKGRMHYIPNSVSNAEDVSMEVMVALLGTSTLGYTVKNLDVYYANIIGWGSDKSGLSEDKLFTPVDNWLPDQAHTLKADVMDSGHINNAVIGKFVNDCYSNNENLLNKTVFRNLQVIENKISNGLYPTGAQMKPSIEGFPCLLVVLFAGETQGSVDIQLLGIYSFNLGRYSIYNQGYVVLDKYYDEKGTELSYTPGTTFNAPKVFLKRANDSSAYLAMCYEGNYDFNSPRTELTNLSNETLDGFCYSLYLDPFTRKYKTYRTGDIKNVKTLTANDNVYLTDNEPIVDSKGNNIQFSELKHYRLKTVGYFWGTDDSYLNLWKNVYTPPAPSLSVDINRITRNLFKTFHDNVCGIFYSKNGVTFGESSSFPTYSLILTASGYVPSENSIGTWQSGGNLTGDAPIGFSVLNTSFYYVIAMLFGLVNSLGKNMQIKMWLDPNKLDLVNENDPTPCFYDMDTGLGLNNFGNDNVPPHVYDSNLYNLNGQVRTSWIAQEQCIRDSVEASYDVYTNKLFGLPEMYMDSVMSQRFAYDSESNTNIKNSIYAYTWHLLRTSVLHNIDIFFDTYFKPQLSSVGELLLNYDYYIKYLANNNQSEMTFLHGDRLSFIRKWLKERVVFLDSIFAYEDNSLIFLYLMKTSNGTGINEDNIPYLNNVNLNISGNQNLAKVQVISNKTLIIKFNNNNYYLEKGVETILEASTNTNSYTLNNSNCITKLSPVAGYLNTIEPIETVGTIRDLEGNTIIYDNANDTFNKQWGTLSSLTEYSALSGDIFKIFKPWDTSNIGREILYSLLRKVKVNNKNVSNISSMLNLEMSIPDTVPQKYKNIFLNLTDIDVSNSSVTNVNIPGTNSDNVEDSLSLYSFIFNNSYINSVNVKNQPLLTSLDFTGCSKLTTVSIINCENIENIELSNELGNSALSEVTIQNCPNLKTIKLNGVGENLTDRFMISISNCPLLKSIEMTDITSEKNGSMSISSCKNLTTLNLYRNKGIKEIKYNNNSNSLVTLNLLETNLLKFNSEEDGIFNFKNFNSISTLKCSMVYGLKYVYFPNNPNKPFDINTSETFFKCINLKRVYGNVALKNTKIFLGCINFSILGIDTTTYNGQSMIKSTGVDSSGNIYYVYKHFLDVNNTLDQENKPLFMEGDGEVTNMTLGYYNTGLYTSIFDRTHCTELDVYYILANIDSNITNIAYLFAYTDSKGDLTIDINNRLFEHQEIDSRIFYRCLNIKNLSCLFYGKGGNKVLNLSNNLFSNLRDCTSIDNMFHTYSLVITQDFILPPKLETLHRFNVIKITNGEISSGNMSLLKGLDQLKDIFKCFNNMDYIDYTTLELPAKVQTIYGSFKSKTSSGSINLSDSVLFTNHFVLRDVCASFVHTGNSSNQKASIEFDFSATNNLVSLGRLEALKSYYNGKQFTQLSDQDESFTFEGMTKVLDGELPTFCSDMKKTLVMFAGVYKDASFSKNNILLPGNLFHGCTKLKYVHYCFYNIQTPFTVDFTSVEENIQELSEDQYNVKTPFKDCPNLTDVSYIFGCDVDLISLTELLDTSLYNKVLAFDKLTKISNLIGSIPYKLFYHGTKSSKLYTVQGFPETEYEDINTYTNKGNNIYSAKIGNEIEYYFENCSIVNNKLRVTPLAKIYTIEEIDEETIQVPKKYTTVFNKPEYSETLNLCPNYIYNRSITSIEGCFQGQYKLSSYTRNVNFLEPNTSYNPFYYIQFGNTYIINTAIDTNKYLYNHVYDGISSNTIPGGVVTLDTINSDISYLTPPDLLKYCSTKLANTSFMFRRCGNPYKSKSPTNIAQDDLEAMNDGFNGRIVPYMMYYTLSVTKMQDMFAGCSNILGYTEDNKYYLIPKNFFSYIPNVADLTGMFSFCYTDNPNISFDVFKDLTKSGVHIERFFYKFLYVSKLETQIPIVSGLFTNKNIYPYINRFFAIRETGDIVANNTSGITQELIIKPNFTIDSSNTKYYTNKNAYRVYYGITLNQNSVKERGHTNDDNDWYLG